MSNKFLNPSDETDLSDVIARVNSNTEAIQSHVGNLANPHTTSTNNIQGTNSPPLNSDDVVEGITNRYLVQPFDTTFDMGGNQILNTTAIGNPSGQMVLAGITSAILLDPSPAPSVGILAQSGANQDINLISSADFDIKNLNTGDNIRLFGDGIQLKDQAGTNYLTLDATEITSFKGINMNTNDITNANVIVRSSNGNLIDFDAGGGLELQSGVGNNIDIKAGSDTAQISGGNASIGETTTNMSLLFQSNAASIQQGLTNIASFTPTLNTSYQDLDMNNNGITNVTSINGLTPVGGLFSGTSDSLNVAATTAEISILPLTFAGIGFGVPPNGFSVGDCFELKLSGPFNSANSDTLTIRLKGGATSTTLLATLVVPLNASSGSVFQLSVFFQIRAIGAAGVADIISDADLTYNQSGGGGSFVGEQSLSQNNTTFDTTVANILDVTAQFSSGSASNDMTTRVSKLQKTY